MNSAHQRELASTNSGRSFDESSVHAADYIPGMYQESLSSPPEQRAVVTHDAMLNHHQHHHHISSPPRKKAVPPPPPPKDKPPPLSTNPSYSNSSIQTRPTESEYQRSFSQDIVASPELKSPPNTRARLPPSSPPLTAQMPLSGLDNDDDGSTPSSPAEIAKELSNLQAFKRMSLDASNQVSDPDLPSTRIP